jgi:hypothetical protein
MQLPICVHLNIADAIAVHGLAVRPRAAPGLALVAKVLENYAS